MEVRVARSLGSKGTQRIQAGGGSGGCGWQKGLFLSLRADKGPKGVPGLGSPQGALGPNGSATRMGGYASIQGEVGRGRQPLLLGLAALWGQQSLSEGKAGQGWWDAVGARWGMVGRRQRVRRGGGALGAGPSDWKCGSAGRRGRGDCRRQGREPGRRVLRCARQEMGAGPWGASGRVARG